ncbi:MAG: DUF366 family protein [Asgard group archaeon]|nr:DUF366 family protein [Asgard group archaeon]
MFCIIILANRYSIMVGLPIEIIFHDFIKQEELYDGTQIQPLWALNTFGVSGDTMVIFRGGMRVSQKEMIDIKDIVRERDKGDILISSDDCIHFIIEMFDDQPANLKVAYHRLYLLAQIVQRIIEQELSIKLKRDGTDLFFESRKLNVAIATSSNNSSKIHFGINIVSTGIPDYVRAIGLKDIKEDIDLEAIAMKIGDRFIEDLDSITLDITKTRTF